MKKRFDIFWFGENGPNWIDAVETLQTAKEQIEKLPQSDSGSYAVVDHRNGQPSFVRREASWQRS